MRGGHGHSMRSPMDDDDHPFVSKCASPWLWCFKCAPPGGAVLRLGCVFRCTGLLHADALRSEAPRAGSLHADARLCILLLPAAHPPLSPTPSCRYQTLEEVAGKVAEVAQDQNGCRFLQKKFDEGGPAAISMVFSVRSLLRAGGRLWHRVCFIGSARCVARCWPIVASCGSLFYWAPLALAVVALSGVLPPARSWQPA